MYVCMKAISYELRYVNEYDCFMIMYVPHMAFCAALRFLCKGRTPQSHCMRLHTETQTHDLVWTFWLEGA